MQIRAGTKWSCCSRCWCFASSWCCSCMTACRLVAELPAGCFHTQLSKSGSPGRHHGLQAGSVPNAEMHKSHCASCTPWYVKHCAKLRSSPGQPKLKRIYLNRNRYSSAHLADKSGRPHTLCYHQWRPISPTLHPAGQHVINDSRGEQRLKKPNMRSCQGLPAHSRAADGMLYDTIETDCPPEELSTNVAGWPAKNFAMQKKRTHSKTMLSWTQGCPSNANSNVMVRWHQAYLLM